MYIFLRLIKNTLCHAFQDLQKGLDLEIISPEVLQNFFDVKQYPLLSELAYRFQVYFLAEKILVWSSSIREFHVAFLSFVTLSILWFNNTFQNSD